MLWDHGCPTCGHAVDEAKSVTRKFEGDTFHFDTEECARVFDGTGSIMDVYQKLVTRQ